MGYYITIEDELDYEFEYEGKKHQVEITKKKIAVPNVGEYGFYRRIYASGFDHVCGAMGYNPMLGDDCPACDHYTYANKVMNALYDQLSEEGILKDTSRRAEENYDI